MRRAMGLRGPVDPDPASPLGIKSRQRGSGVKTAWFRNRAVVVLESRFRGSGVNRRETIRYSVLKTARYESPIFRNTT